MSSRHKKQKSNLNFQVAFLINCLLYATLVLYLLLYTISCGFLSSPLGLSSFGFFSGLTTITGGFSFGGGFLSPSFCAEAGIEMPTTNAATKNNCLRIFIILFSSLLLIFKARGKVWRVRPLFLWQYQCHRYYLIVFLNKVSQLLTAIL